MSGCAMEPSRYAGPEQAMGEELAAGAKEDERGGGVRDGTDEDVHGGFSILDFGFWIEGSTVPPNGDRAEYLAALRQQLTAVLIAKNAKAAKASF